jgi:uncharacterized protein YqgC (DUF456 family)
MLLTIVIDLFAPVLGAGNLKVSKWGILGAFFGSFLGIFLMGWWGIVIGPFLGAIFGELSAGSELKKALRIGLGTLLALIVGILVKIIVVTVMLGFLIASWF